MEYLCIETYLILGNAHAFSRTEINSQIVNSVRDCNVVGIYYPHCHLCQTNLKTPQCSIRTRCIYVFHKIIIRISRTGTLGRYWSLWL